MKSFIGLTILAVVFLALVPAWATDSVARNDKELLKRVVKLEKANEAMKKTIEAKTIQLAKWMDEYHEKKNRGNLYHYHKIRATK